MLQRQVTSCGLSNYLLHVAKWRKRACILWKVKMLEKEDQINRLIRRMNQGICHGIFMIWLVNKKYLVQTNQPNQTQPNPKHQKLKWYGDGNSLLNPLLAATHLSKKKQPPSEDPRTWEQAVNQQTHKWASAKHWWLTEITMIYFFQQKQDMVQQFNVGTLANTVCILSDSEWSRPSAAVRAVGPWTTPSAGRTENAQARSKAPACGSHKGSLRSQISHGMKTFLVCSWLCSP